MHAAYYTFKYIYFMNIFFFISCIFNDKPSSPRRKLQIYLQNHVFFYNNALALFCKIQYNILRSDLIKY